MHAKPTICDYLTTDISSGRVTDDQRAAWVKAMQPVGQELGTELVGAEVMARLKTIAAGA